MRVGRVLAMFALALLISGVGIASQNAQLASADGGWQISYEGSNPVYTWSPDCWVDCEIVLDIEFFGAPGGSSYFKLEGEKDDDPLVTQTTKNNSQATWLDWHVDILNGTIDRVDVPVVRKVATGADAANWEIQFIHNDGYTDGFGARWVGGNTSVATGESLSIRFRWTPTNTGTVSIRQYPTDTGVFIPEPSSIVILTSGLASLGFAIRRRRG